MLSVSPKIKSENTIKLSHPNVEFQLHTIDNNRIRNSFNMCIYIYLYQLLKVNLRHHTTSGYNNIYLQMVYNY